MEKSFLFFFLLTAMVSQAAPNGIVSFPITEVPCAFHPESKLPERGKVKWFNESKGFGFITKENGSDIFFNFRFIPGGSLKTFKEGDKVQFDISIGQRGVSAINVQHLD